MNALAEKRLSATALFSAPSVADELVLVDGITRAGKMLMAKLVSAFERIDFFQYQPVLEHIPILSRIGVMDAANAATYWRLSAGMATLDRAAGRNLNLRIGDSSSIDNAPDADRYLSRSREADFDGLLARFQGEGRVPAFLTHETLPHAALVFAAAPKTRFVEVERNLVDLAYSWYRRGWGTRFGADAKALVPVLDVAGYPVPWFAAGFAETFGQSYTAMSPADRCAASILALYREGEGAMARLSPAQRKQVHWVRYEDLLRDPRRALEGVGAFLGGKPLPGMDAILVREGLTGASPPKSSRVALREVVSAGLADRLDAAAEEQFKRVH